MKALPVGIDNFENLILGTEQGEHYYYVDKTPLIRELASTGGKVYLIPRPRRFGKSLNLDMIWKFMTEDPGKGLFDGLKISEDREFCEKFQGQYPVLYFNMKDIKEFTFTAACEAFSNQISDIVGTYYEFLLDSPKLSQTQQKTCALYEDPEKWKDEKGQPAESLPVSKLKKGNQPSRFQSLS